MPQTLWCLLLQIDSKNVVSLHGEMRDGEAFIRVGTVRLQHHSLDLMADHITLTKTVTVPGGVTIQSTCGHLRLQSLVTADSIVLEAAEKVSVLNESTLRCTEIKILSPKTAIEGSLLSREGQSKGIQSKINVSVQGDLHLSVDGKIGFRNETADAVDYLHLDVAGAITNFGKIAGSVVDVICTNLRSCQDCPTDSAQRGYDAFTKLYSIARKEAEYVHPHKGNLTEGSLHLAVEASDPSVVATLLEAGTDPCISDQSGKSPTDVAISILHAGKQQKLATYSKQGTETTDKRLRFSFLTEEDLRKRDNVLCVLQWWKNKRGTIFAEEMTFRARKTVHDISQIAAKTLHLQVDEDLIIEHASIWHSGSVTGICQGQVTINGQVRLDTFKDFRVHRNVYTTENGLVVLKTGGKVTVKGEFINENLWFTEYGLLDLSLGNLYQHETSQIVASVSMGAGLKITLSNDNTEGWFGTVQAAAIELELKARCRCFGSIISSKLTKVVLNKTDRLADFDIAGVLKVVHGPLIVTKQVKECVLELSTKPDRGGAARTNLREDYTSSGEHHSTLNDNPDILVSGQITVLGVFANGVHIVSRDSSLIEVGTSRHPQSDRVICMVGDLTSEKDSEWRFVAEEARDIITVYCSGTWCHRGLTSFHNKSGQGTVVHSKVGTFINAGQLRGIDALLLEINVRVRNESLFMATSSLVFEGDGHVENYGKIECPHGGLEVRLIEGNVRNRDQIVAGSIVHINAGHIDNAGGVIESKCQMVYLRWCAKQPANLEGVVLTRIQLVTEALQAETFELHCSGGATLDKIKTTEGREPKFWIPKKGLLMKCEHGSVISNSLLRHDDDIAPSLYCIYRKECRFQKNASVADIKLILRSSDSNATKTNAGLGSEADLKTEVCKIGLTQPTGNRQTTKEHAPTIGEPQPSKDEMTEESILNPKTEVQEDYQHAQQNVTDSSETEDKKTVNNKFPQKTVDSVVTLLNETCTGLNTSDVKINQDLQVENHSQGDNGDNQVAAKDTILVDIDVKGETERKLLAIETGVSLEVGTLSSTGAKVDVELYLQTSGTGHFRCQKQIEADSNLQIEGNIILASGSVIKSDLTLEMMQRCVCTIESNSNFSKRGVYVRAGSDIILNGSLKSKDTERQGCVWIESSEGNIAVSESARILLPRISFTAPRANTININGQIDSSAAIVLQAGMISFDSSSLITCKEIYCMAKTPESSVPKHLSLGGVLKVRGQIQCQVDEFEQRASGQLEVEGAKESILSAEKGNIQLSGKLVTSGECRIVFVAKESVSIAALGANLGSGATDGKEPASGLILEGGKEVTVDKRTEVHMTGGTLLVRCPEEESRIILNGTIRGPISDVDLVTSDADEEDKDDVRDDIQPNLKVEGYDITLKSSLMSGIPCITLVAQNCLLQGKEGRIEKCQYLQIGSKVLQIEGTICKIYRTLYMEPWNALITGNITKTYTMKVIADLLFVNSGVMESRQMGLVAPVVMNCCQTTDSGNAPTVVAIGGEEQKQLIIEGLLCLLVGGVKHAKKIEMRSTLHFEFAGKTTTSLPQTKDLRNWNQVMTESLKPAAATFGSPDAVRQIVEHATENMPKVACCLSSSSLLCQSVVGIVDKMKSGGVDKFQLDDICSAMSQAHGRYTSISTLRTLPKRILANIKKTALNTRRYIMDIFGPHCFASTLKFDSSQDSDEGIEEISWFSYRSGPCVVQTGGEYAAESKIWRNEGTVVATGDLFVTSETIEYVPGRGRAMKAFGQIAMAATKDLDISNAEANKKILLQVMGKMRAKKVRGKDDIQIQCADDLDVRDVSSNKSLQVTGGKSVHVERSQAKVIHVDGKKDVSLKKSSASASAFVKGSGNVTVQQVSSQDLLALGDSNVTADSVQASNLCIEAKKNANLKLATVTGDATVKGETHASAGYSEVKETLRVEAGRGKASLTGKVKAGAVQIEGGDEGLDVVGENGKADHETGHLRLHGRTIPASAIKSMLDGTGPFESLQVSDQLDLAVGDQNVVLGAISRKLNFGVFLEARNVTVDTIRTEGTLTLEATQGSLTAKGSLEGNNIHMKAKKDVTFESKWRFGWKTGTLGTTASDTVTIEAEKGSVYMTGDTSVSGKDVGLKAGKNINIQASEVKANENINLKTASGSLNMKASDIKGDFVDIDVAENINVEATGGEDSPANRSQIIGGKGQEYDAGRDEKRTMGLMMKAGGNMNVDASTAKCEGDSMIDVKGNIKMTDRHHDYLKQKETKTTFLGFKKEMVEVYDTHIDRSELASTGGRNMVRCEGNFSSSAAVFSSKDGNQITAKGKVSLRNRVTKKRTHVCGKVLWGMHRTDKRKEAEENHGTVLEDGGASSNTWITSEMSDIHIKGGNIKSKGDVTLKAEKGSITLEGQKLKHTEATETSGLMMTGDGIYYGYERDECSSETVADNGIYCGNLLVKGRVLSALDSSGINTAGNLELDVNKFCFKAATLTSTQKRDTFSLGVGYSGVSFSYEHEEGKQTYHQNQSTIVDGTLKLKNVTDGQLIGANTDAGHIEGEVRNLDVVSLQDESEHLSIGVNAGIDFKGIPSGGFNVECGYSRFLNNRSGINILKGGSESLKVGTCKLNAAHVVFEGEVTNFADRISVTDILDHSVQFNCSASAALKSNLKSKGRSRKGLTGCVHVGLNASVQKQNSTIASKSGKVHDTIANKVNTDLEKEKVDIMKFEFSASGAVDTMKEERHRHGKTKKAITHSWEVGACANVNVAGMNLGYEKTSSRVRSSKESSSKSGTKKKVTERTSTKSGWKMNPIDKVPGLELRSEKSSTKMQESKVSTNTAGTIQAKTKKSKASTLSQGYTFGLNDPRVPSMHYESEKTTSKTEMSNVSTSKKGKLKRKTHKLQTSSTARQWTFRHPDHRVPGIKFGSKETASKQETSDVSLTKSGKLKQKTKTLETSSKSREGTLGFGDSRLSSITFGSKETASKEKMADVSLTKSGKLKQKTKTLETSSKSREGTLGFGDSRLSSITFESKETASKEKMADVSLTKSGKFKQKTKTLETSSKSREGTLGFGDSRLSSIMFGSKETASKEKMADVSLTKSGKFKQKTKTLETSSKSREGTLGFGDSRLSSITFGSKETASKEKMADVSLTKSGKFKQKTKTLETSSKSREGTLGFGDSRLSSITFGSKETASKEKMADVSLTKSGKFKQKTKTLETSSKSREGTLGFGDSRVSSITFGSKETASKEKTVDVSLTKSGKFKQKTETLETSSKSREGTLRFGDSRLSSITFG